MMEQESNLKLYARVFWKQIIFSWQTEIAYIGNIIGNLLSTFFYNLAYIIFLDVVIKKVDTFAGYTFVEMLVFSLVSQIIYYSQAFMTFGSANKFTRRIRNGNFDIMILKPISLLYQSMTISLQPFSTLVFAIPSFALYIFMIIINGGYEFRTYNIMIAIISILIGMIFIHFYKYAFAMTIFKNKENKNLLKTIEFANNVGGYPYEAFEKPLRFFVSIIAPIFLASAVPTLYLLDRTTSPWPFIYQTLALIVSIISTLIMWRRGLKIYDSASS